MFSMRCLTVFLLVCASQILEADDSCNRSARNIQWSGGVIPVYVDSDPSRPVTVEFEDERDLRNAINEVSGLSVTAVEQQWNRIELLAIGLDLNGFLLIDGASGTTFQLRPILRPGCPDSLVSIKSVQATVENLGAKNSASQRPLHLKDLMQHMWHSKLPTNYRRVTYSDRPLDERIVYAEKDFYIALEEQFIGPKYVGSIFRAQNSGRLAYKLDLETFSWSADAITTAFGIVEEVNVVPDDGEFDPAPEFAEDVLSQVNKGYLYMVTERPVNKGSY